MLGINMSDPKINMSNTKIWAITVICIICGVGLYLAAPSITPVFVAMFLAYIIHPLAVKIQNRLKLRRKSAAVILTIALIAAIIGITIYSISNNIVHQAMMFAEEFGRLVAQAEQLLDFSESMGPENFFTSHLEAVLMQFLALLNTFIVSFITSVLGFIFRFTDVVIVLILLFLFLLEGPKPAKKIVAKMPEILREAASNFFNGIHGIVWGYLKTMVIISICFGAVFGIILFILDIPFAGLLGILGGVLNMIPFIGSIISGAIAVIIAFLYHDIYRALISVALIIALNAVQGGIIAPLVLANKLRIHPIFVITSLLVCNYVWGIPGMFIAVPILGLARLLMQETFNVIRKL